MKAFLLVLSFGFLMFGTAQAREIDSCTTFADAPPSISDNMLCAKEAQHSREMELPPADEQTVLSLTDLYELKWSLHSMHRFQNQDGNFVYRVYMIRD